MTSYVDKKYYQETYQGTQISTNDLDKTLLEASLHIDTLTFNRIVARKFENLTKFQQDIIKRVVCKLADFEYENKDLLNTPFSNYSINGVSMGFGEKWNLKIQNGIAIPKEDFCLLQQTGLTCRNPRC